MEKEIIKAYALKNAIEHEGKANQSSVLNSLFIEGLKKEQIAETLPLINSVVEEVNSMKISEQIKEFEKFRDNIHERKKRQEGELPELPNAKRGEVVMRLAPFPSGPLHIGNTRALILNYEYVKKYEGKFILFFDDTIGSEDKQIIKEAYDLILEGVKWLGIKPDEILYKSDRLEKYYAYAEEMIKKGYMYVCDCPREEFQRIKEKGISCPCRSLPPEKNYDRWKKMFSKEIREGELVVRLKTSMQDPDPSFRDRVMLKICDREHPRKNRKYRVWPSMEFSWGIDDHLIGTTHVLRGIEHQMSTKVQNFIRGIFNWKDPISLYLGLFQIEGVKISKSKGAKEVREGKLLGWNDPRLWSLQSLRDRGIRPESIKNFIISQGLNKSNTVVPIDVLYSINRKLIDNCPRYFFIKEPFKIKVNGAPQLNVALPLHPTINLGFRQKETFQEFFIEKEDYEKMKDGETYRLMYLFNFKCSQPNELTEKYFSFVSVDNSKERIKSIHWTPAFSKIIKVRVMMEDGSFIEGIGEGEMEKIKEGTEVQFERFGFVNLRKKEKDFLEFWFTHK